jgi:hypothetical protein
MTKPICKYCHKKDKVVLVNYQRQWRGFECERCYAVVATIYETNERGNKIVYHPYNINQA